MPVHEIRLMAMPPSGETYIYRDECGELRLVGVTRKQEEITELILLSAITKYSWMMVDEPFTSKDDMEVRRQELAEEWRRRICQTTTRTSRRNR